MVNSSSFDDSKLSFKGAKGRGYIYARRTIKHRFYRSMRMAEPARLEQLTDDLKTPQKASSLFFGPSVSFDTISDPWEGS